MWSGGKTTRAVFLDNCFYSGCSWFDVFETKAVYMEMTTFPTTAIGPVGMQVGKLLCRRRRVIYTCTSACISCLWVCLCVGSSVMWDCVFWSLGVALSPESPLHTRSQSPSLCRSLTHTHTHTHRSDRHWFCTLYKCLIYFANTVWHKLTFSFYNYDKLLFYFSVCVCVQVCVRHSSLPFLSSLPTSMCVCACAHQCVRVCVT